MASRLSCHAPSATDSIWTVAIGDAATWVAAAVALIAGAAGVLFGVLGYRQAKQANEKAEAANRIAADALGQAAKANEIAEHANQLSEEANTVSSRSVAQQEEDWFVDWRIQWNAEESSVALINTGSKDARQPTVTVSGNNIHDFFDDYRDVLPGASIGVPLPQIRDQRAQHASQKAAVAAELRQAGLVYIEGSFHTELKVTIRWKTGLGFPQSRELELKAK